jgi:hypothetical protein
MQDKVIIFSPKTTSLKSVFYVKNGYFELESGKGHCPQVGEKVRGLKVAFDESVSATGFKLGFKSSSFFFGFKGKIRFNFPRLEFCCVRYFSRVVFGKAGFQICCPADITLIWMINTS